MLLCRFPTVVHWASQRTQLTLSAALARWSAFTLYSLITVCNYGMASRATHMRRHGVLPPLYLPSHETTTIHSAVRKGGISHKCINKEKAFQINKVSIPRYLTTWKMRNRKAKKLCRLPRWLLVLWRTFSAFNIPFLWPVKNIHTKELESWGYIWVDGTLT